MFVNFWFRVTGNGLRVTTGIIFLIFGCAKQQLALLRKVSKLFESCPNCLSVKGKFTDKGSQPSNATKAVGTANNKKSRTYDYNPELLGLVIQQ